MKKSNKSKKTRKVSTVKKKKTQFGGLLKSKQAAIFVAAFALVGAFLLFRTYAATDLPPASNDIVAAYLDSKPTTMRVDETGDLAPESISSMYVVLADGTIICDDGNSSGEVLTGTLPKGQLVKLQQDAKKTGIEKLPSIISDDPTTQVSTYEGILIGSRDSHKTVQVFPGQAKPSAFENVQKLIVKKCDVASKKQQRGDVKEINLPEAAAESASVDSDSIISRIYDALLPKASATSTNYVNHSSDFSNLTSYSDDQFNKINAARKSHGIPALKRYWCMDKMGQTWSYVMAAYNNLVHRPEQSAKDFLVKECSINLAKYSPYEHISGENVGRTYGDSAGLFKAYMSSPDHKKNILNRAWTHVGVGTFRRNAAPNKGIIYSTQNFINIK